MASGITLKKTGRLVVDIEAVADVISAAAVGHVINRQHDGLDVHDQRFKKYSAGYTRMLEREGESTNVDHRRSGLMLSLLKELRRERVPIGDGASRITLHIGVGPGGDRNLIAARLQELRPWLGISPKGMKAIAKLATKARAIRALKEQMTKKLL